MGQARGCVRLLHRRGQGAEPGGGDGADWEAGGGVSAPSVSSLRADPPPPLHGGGCRLLLTREAGEVARCGYAAWRRGR
ncbi:hypothetical protein CSW59_20035 [Caulobacter sp. BP25]|nr:hypothetical protein CSW59_20035 [Caulobacter sp. BP25]